VIKYKEYKGKICKRIRIFNIWRENYWK